MQLGYTPCTTRGCLSHALCHHLPPCSWIGAKLPHLWADLVTHQQDSVCRQMGCWPSGLRGQKVERHWHKVFVLLLKQLVFSLTLNHPHQYKECKFLCHAEHSLHLWTNILRLCILYVPLAMSRECHSALRLLPLHVVCKSAHASPRTTCTLQ